jgi:Flp pilus assembly pilin Flp
MEVISMFNTMEMKEYLNAFNKNQEGAVTVDFVVLTAGVVLIGAAAMTTLSPKVTAAISAISL